MIFYILLPEILFLWCIFQYTCNYIFVLYNENNTNKNISQDTEKETWWDFRITYILITFMHFIAAPVWLHQDYTNAAVGKRTIQVFWTLRHLPFLLYISDPTISDSCKEPLIFVEVHSGFHFPFKKLMWHYHSGSSAPCL